MNRCIVSGSATVQDVIGMDVLSNIALTASATNQYSLIVRVLNNNSVTNSYGIYVERTSGTMQYGLYSEGGLKTEEFVSYEITTNTPVPSNTEAIGYFKDNKLIFAHDDAGTIRYKYLDLTGTSVTWVHTTTAP